MPSLNRSRMNNSRRSPLRQSARSPMRQSVARSPVRVVSPTRSPNRSIVIGGAAPEATVNRFPENADSSTKLRFVFKELDLKGTSRVELDGFRRTLKALNIGFTEATVEDLFERADMDKKGSIDYAEFLNFAQHYPLLVESIYSRSKEVFDHGARENEMAQARELQASRQRRERETNEQWQNAKDLLAAQQRQFESIEASAKEAHDALTDRNKELVMMQQDLDVAKAERLVKERDLLEAKEAQHQAQKPLRNAERNLEASLLQLRDTEIMLDSCRERERELDAMLEEAKRETQRQFDMTTQLNDQIAELREQSAAFAAGLADADALVAQQAAELRAADEQVRTQKQDLEAAEAVKAEMAAALKHLQALTEEERSALIPFRQRQGQQEAAHAEALAAFEEADRALTQLEAQHAAHQDHRTAAEEAEQALLENEVRLREQRKNLNTRDDVLWDEGGHFLRVAGRSDTRIVTTNGHVRGI